MGSDRFEVRAGDRTFTAEKGANLGELLRASGILDMPCGGKGKCGKCRVRVTGDCAPVTEREKQLLAPEELAGGIRLACRTVIEGECSVEIPKTAAASICSDGAGPLTVGADGKRLYREYGMAVDIGTTTVAARLYGPDGLPAGQASCLNPQRSFGADVISRMEAALGGAASELAAQIRETVSSLAAEMAAQAGIETEKIDGAVIAGNTVMLYLLTGTDTGPLTHAPFNAERLFGETLTAEELGIGALRGDARIYLPPCAAAFIGADTSAALLSSGICDTEGTALLTDIGTNGETVLKCGEGLFACSTAAGPAFEGAGISMGMGGREGAVDKVSLNDDGTLRAHVIGGGSACGICGSGLIDAVACLVRTEAIDSTGYMEDEPAVIAAPVVLTQSDVRQAQLAKSAICSGMRTLLKKTGISENEVGTLYIAGGFGSFLDVSSAVTVGLIPETLAGNVKVLGNASLSGASMMLLSDSEAEKCAGIAKKMRVIELSGDPLFAAEYVENMLFGADD